MADLTKYRPADLTTRKSKQDIGSEIDAFVERTRAMQVATRPQRGRLIFTLDATASRQPTWDMACQLQAEMFWEVSNLMSSSSSIVGSASAEPRGGFLAESVLPI